MDVAQAAERAARQLLAGAPSPGERERAARLLEVAGDARRAAEVWRQAGHDLEARARDAAGRGGPAESVPWLLEAAEAYATGGDGGAAARVAGEGVAAWPAFEEAKRIVVDPGRGPSPSEGGEPEGRGGRKLRRLPGSRKGSRSSPEEPEEQAGELPSMFLEARARLLHLAGREAEAEAAYTGLADAVAREVARRRGEQQWQEALSAARSWLKAALRAGGRARLDAVRPEFVSLAREAAAEALTPEYFARGHDEVPARAMGEALLEAHALGNESFAAKHEAEMQTVLERTAQVLDALRSPRTAAEALLSAEHEWPMVSARPGLRGRLLQLAESGQDFDGGMGLTGLARSHPLRAEVEDFATRLADVVGRANERTGAAYTAAAAAAAAADDARALELAARALEVARAEDLEVRAAALRVRRQALVRLGRAPEAEQAHGEVLEAVQGAGEEDDVGLQEELEEARFAAESGRGSEGAVEAARRALAVRLRSRAASLFEDGDAAGARARFEAAAALGDEESVRWLKVVSLAPAPVGDRS